MSTLGQNIAYLRKRKGITQEKLAETFQVSAQAVSKWENGISCPDITLLKPIATLLGVTVDQILSNEIPLITQELPYDQNSGKNLKIDFIDSKDKIAVNVPLEAIEDLSKREEIKDKPFLNSESELFKKVNFSWLKECIANGISGVLLQMKSEDGTEVKISIE